MVRLRLPKGLQYFEAAVRLDPSYARAHSGIADSCIVDGGHYLGISLKEVYTRARAAAERADHLPYRKVNPRLDPLRDDPRFQDLQRRMGLE